MRETSAPRSDARRFDEAAVRLAGLAAQVLRWPPAVFWNATPGELAASLAPPVPGEIPPTREEIARLIESDHHG